MDRGPRSIVWRVTLVCAALAAPGGPPIPPTMASADDASSPEARAIGYLVREVPRWSVENRCFSCHNNGDGARALYTAARLGFAVPDGALDDTSRWLTAPESWDRNGGEGPFSDKTLARLQFTAALAAAVRGGRVAGREALTRAAERLAGGLGEDGSWPMDESVIGSPATYGRPLATVLAREVLRDADPIRFRDPIARADRWLAGWPIRTVLDASAFLLLRDPPPSPDASTRRTLSLDLLRRAQSEEGGWGPYVTAPPEPFDTALALLALARCGDAPDIRAMRRRGRLALIALQQPDGSWPETTRPPGAESYAQRLSTTAWATLALLATRDDRPPP